MSYFQGFLIPVKDGNRQAYRDMAAKAAPVFIECGAIAIVETWGQDVPDGKRTDMKRAVAAEADETIVFSWIWWPDKATCDAATPKLMIDERMQPDGDVPFDMKRMIFAGYESVLDAGPGGKFGYVDGVVGPAPEGGRQAFTDHARMLGDYFLNAGATRIVDGWGVDMPDGKVTDFKRAVAAETGEVVVFGWLAWPDKATRDAAFAGMADHPELMSAPPGFDMARAIFGRFVPILDTDHE